MGNKRRSSREKIVEAALELFAKQGTHATTTKEIAEKAGVNEVTLFRQFGSKHGLLLAVIEEAPILKNMQASLAQIADSDTPVKDYGRLALDLLGSVPELVRSLIGDSGQSPAENLRAIGHAIQQANAQTVSYLRQSAVSLPGDMSHETAASLLNTLILGRAVTAFASEEHGLWQDTDFLSAVANMFVPMSAQASGPSSASESGSELGLTVQDLPNETVRSLMQRAKKLGAQQYALAYVLFGAGLRLEEVASLTKSQSLSSKSQHLLIVTGDLPRQVPLNRWIAGNRYGSYVKNPLTQWLKTRQDETAEIFTAEIFVDENSVALGAAGILQCWEAIASETITVTGQPPTPFQARQTWCIELLMKGMSLENLSILSGFSLEELARYSQRSREKVALEEAIAIDQKNS